MDQTTNTPADRAVAALDAMSARHRLWDATAAEGRDVVYALVDSLCLPDNAEVGGDALTNSIEAWATVPVAGPWSAVRAEARRIAAILEARRWERSPGGYVFRVERPAPGARVIRLRVRVAPADAGVLPETCREVEVEEPAIPARMVRRIVCEGPTEEAIDAT